MAARALNHLVASKPGAVRRKVLITGVSEGRGRALAMEMARRGNIVIGCDLFVNELEDLRSELRGVCPSLPPNSHFVMRVDVRSNEEVENFAQEVMERDKCPDIIVNNAGIINQAGLFWDISAEDFDEVIKTNVKGAANILRHFIPLMIDKGHGMIVNFSIAEEAIGPLGQVTPYMASDSAVIGLTASVAKDLPPGLSIFCLETGLTNTQMLSSCIGSEAAAVHETPNAWARKTASRILAL